MAQRKAVPDLAALDREVIGDVWTSDEAYRNLVYLCDECGSRFGGTESEREAVDYLLAKMKEYGLENVHTEEFEYTGWARGTAKLQATSPEPREFPCIALPYCGTATVEGRLVFLGSGNPEVYAEKAAEIKDNIVMVTTESPPDMKRVMHRMEKFGRAVAAGAVAFIWMRDEPGLLEETGSLRFNAEADIPGIGVSKETGAAILRLAEKGPVKLKVTTKNKVGRMSSWNICGELPGQESPRRLLFAGGHLDGHDIAPGAMDNGSGTVIVLEAARALARIKDKLPNTLRFVIFPLEEIGLIGSEEYVHAHRREMRNAQFMVNVDAAGAGGEPILLVQGWKELLPVFKGMAKRMQQPWQLRSNLNPYSDQFNFAAAGVPSAFMSSTRPAGRKSGERGWGHTAADTLDKVSPRGLQMDALNLARLLLYMSFQEQDWPASHKGKAEIKKLLEAQDLWDVLGFEKRLPLRGW
ncbi:MAG: M20/M25/M40 family metallo-hydrolase [Bacillota bacterium]